MYAQMEKNGLVKDQESEQNDIFIEALFLISLKLHSYFFFTFFRLLLVVFYAY